MRDPRAACWARSSWRVGPGAWPWFGGARPSGNGSMPAIRTQRNGPGAASQGAPAGSQGSGRPRRGGDTLMNWAGWNGWSGVKASQEAASPPAPDEATSLWPGQPSSLSGMMAPVPPALMVCPTARETGMSRYFPPPRRGGNINKKNRSHGWTLALRAGYCWLSPD